MDRIITERAIQRVADRRIEQATAEGKFDNLAGEGEPLADVSLPYDPTQWVRDWLKRNNSEDVKAHRRAAAESNGG